MNPFYGVKLPAAARRAEDLVAEINRLRSQLAEAREAHAFDKRAHRDTVAVLTTSWERDAAKIRAERYSLQKERNDYRRMWIKTLSQADRAEVDAKQDRDRLVTEVRRFAGELSAESYVYRQVASRLLDLLDHAAAPVEAPAEPRPSDVRCPTCGLFVARPAPAAPDPLDSLRAAFVTLANQYDHPETRAVAHAIRAHLGLPIHAKTDTAAAPIPTTVDLDAIEATYLARLYEHTRAPAAPVETPTEPRGCHRLCDVEVSGRHTQECTPVTSIQQPPNRASTTVEGEQ